MVTLMAIDLDQETVRRTMEASKETTTELHQIDNLGILVPLNKLHHLANIDQGRLRLTINQLRTNLTREIREMNKGRPSSSHTIISCETRLTLCIYQTSINLVRLYKSTAPL